MQKWGCKFDTLKSVVDNNDKKRFELTEEDGKSYIRAAQGHSMTAVATEELLKEITNPFEYTEIVHGTYYDPLPLIMQGGLNKRGRNHVHFAIGTPGKNGVISGMRSSCQVVVELNLTKAMYGEHKLKFFESSNKVILSEGLADGSIPVQCFRSVLDF